MGKRNPFAYFMFTLSLIACVLYLGTEDVRENLGIPVQEKIYPLGSMDREIVTREGNFVCPTFHWIDPTDESDSKGGAVDVIRVEGKELILSFTDEIYRSYPLRDQVLDLALRVLVRRNFRRFLLCGDDRLVAGSGGEGWTDLDFSLEK